METFPIEGEALPVKTKAIIEYPNGSANIVKEATYYKGWLLFLDEFTSASKAVQAAAYKLVLDRMVGQHNLHKNVAIVCAGNKDSDGAIVEEMSTALQSRLVHMELVVDTKEWLTWANTNDIDFRITSFMEFQPHMLYTFRPDHTDKTYASPRTWEFANRIIKANNGEAVGEDVYNLLAGTISHGVTAEFSTFCKIFQDLPKIADIIAEPEKINVPSEPSILFAITGSLSGHVSNDNINQLVKYVVRLPIEFQVVCLRSMIARDKAIMSTPAVQTWMTKNANMLF